MSSGLLRIVAGFGEFRVFGKVSVEMENYVFHNDDYGFFVEQSKRILRCIKEGVVNSVSVMGNSECLAEAMPLLRIGEKKVWVTTHLNVVDGYCLANPSEVGMIVDDNGIFTHNFLKLLVMSYVPGTRTKLKNQFKKEIRLQINHIMPYMDVDGIRLDSHMHYHQIPAMFDAMMEVIREDELKVAYIRMPYERLSIYRRANVSVSAINLIKVMILNSLCIRNLRKYKEFLNGCEQRLFVGVARSGHMDTQAVSRLWPVARKWADEHGCGVEMLSHPGGVKEPECLEKVYYSGDREFLTSPWRDAEAEAWKELSL